MSLLNKLRAGLKEMGEGAVAWRVWMALAQEDIGDQHRRTTLGPVWLLINYLFFAGTFIFVFHRGDTSTPHYAAYVATGLFVWFYIMETLIQAVTLFVREESFIKGTRLPLSVFVMRLTMQTAIRAAYALAGCLGILLFSDVGLSAGWLFSLLAILLALLTAPAAITVLAFLGAYFPDSQFLVSNMMRLGMFLTPIFWIYEQASAVRAVFYYWNPFTYYVEIVRQPILTGQFPQNAFVACLLMSATLWVLAIILFSKLRREVVFVL